MKYCVFLSLFLIGLSSSSQTSKNFPSEVTLNSVYSFNSVGDSRNSFEIGLQVPKSRGYLNSSPQFTRRTMSTASSSETPTKFLITTSPFTLFTKWRFEKLTNKKITYGARAEIFLVPVAFAVLPYTRFYFFGKEAEGIYSELALGPVLYPQPLFDASPLQTQFRVGLGVQWFTKNNRPMDINLSINADSSIKWYGGGEILEEDVINPLGIMGAGSILKLRFQTGFGK